MTQQAETLDMEMEFSVYAALWNGGAIKPAQLEDPEEQVSVINTSNPLDTIEAAGDGVLGFNPADRKRLSKKFQRLVLMRVVSRERGHQITYLRNPLGLAKKGTASRKSEPPSTTSAILRYLSPMKAYLYLLLPKRHVIVEINGKSVRLVRDVVWILQIKFGADHDVTKAITYMVNKGWVELLFDVDSGQKSTRGLILLVNREEACKGKQPEEIETPTNNPERPTEENGMNDGKGIQGQEHGAVAIPSKTGRQVHQRTGVYMTKAVDYKVWLAFVRVPNQLEQKPGGFDSGLAVSLGLNAILEITSLFRDEVLVSIGRMCDAGLLMSVAPETWKLDCNPLDVTTVLLEMPRRLLIGNPHYIARINMVREIAVDLTDLDGAIYRFASEAFEKLGMRTSLEVNNQVMDYREERFRLTTTALRLFVCVPTKQGCTYPAPKALAGCDFFSAPADVEIPHSGAVLLEPGSKRYRPAFDPLTNRFRAELQHWYSEQARFKTEPSPSQEPVAALVREPSTRRIDNETGEVLATETLPSNEVPAEGGAAQRESAIVVRDLTGASAVALTSEDSFPKSPMENLLALIESRREEKQGLVERAQKLHEQVAMLRAQSEALDVKLGLLNEQIAVDEADKQGLENVAAKLAELFYRRPELIGRSR